MLASTPSGDEMIAQAQMASANTFNQATANGMSQSDAAAQAQMTYDSYMANYVNSLASGFSQMQSQWPVKTNSTMTTTGMMLFAGAALIIAALALG